MLGSNKEETDVMDVLVTLFVIMLLFIGAFRGCMGAAVENDLDNLEYRVEALEKSIIKLEVIEEKIEEEVEEAIAEQAEEKTAKSGIQQELDDWNAK